MEGPKTATTFQLNSPVEKDEILLPEYDEGRVPELDDLGQGEHPGPECHHLCRGGSSSVRINQEEPSIIFSVSDNFHC